MPAKAGIQYSEMAVLELKSRRYWIARSSRAMTTFAELMLPGFGEFDLDAQLDLGKHGIQTRVARRGLQVDRSLPQPAHRRGIEIARQQSDLEIVEHVERAFAALHRTFAPLGWILLDS